MKNKETTVGVFFGGRSPEHEVSIITGELIVAELKKIGYPVVPVYVDRQGKWYADEVLGSLKFFLDPSFEEKLKKMPSCSVAMGGSNGKFSLFQKKIFSGSDISIDMAFPAFHGMNGEDGTIQGLFELCDVPYVGCEVAASVMTMDKVLTKEMYRSAGISTTDFVSFSAFDWKKNKAEVIQKIEKLKWPLFVKPARLGSSIGIAKVTNRNDLENACEVALHYDSKVIIEEGIDSVADITCAVLGNNDPFPSLIQEAVFSGGHFSYEAKYLEGGGAQFGNAESSIIIPARLNEELTKEIQEMAIRVFKLFGCSGIARVDFLYDKVSQKYYVNEVNTMPGTLYHHLWKASGIEIRELLEKLITLAREKYAEKNSVAVTFKSDVLKYANSVKLKIN